MNPQTRRALHNGKKRIAAILVIMMLLFSFQFTAHAEMSVTASPNALHPDTRIDLSWGPVTNVKYYDIYRDTVLITRINVDNTLNPLRYADTGLTPETAYEYRVNAVRSDETVIDTGAGSASTSQMQAPEIISSVFDVNTREIKLKWDHNSLAAEESVIKRVYEDDHDEIVVTIDNADSAENDYFSTTINGPGLGETTAQYVVVSKNSNGHTSPDSDPVTILPIEAPYITAVCTDGISTIEWFSGQDPEGDPYPYATYFNLERSKWNGTAWEDWHTVNTMLAGTYINDIPSTGGAYRYRLTARDSSGYSGYSNISQTVIVPAAPTSISCELVNSDTVEISWDNDPGNTSTLIVQRKVGSGGVYENIKSYASTATSHSDSFSFASGATYYYRVVAFESDQNTSISPECSITPALPTAPSGLRMIVQSATEVKLDWTDNSNNETSFRIERKTDSGAFALLDTVEQDITTYTDSGLASGHTYTYRVCANNPMGNSSYTNQVSVSPTGITAPATLTVTPVSSSRIDLSWTYPGTVNQRTIIERKTGQAGTWSEIANLSSGTTTYSNTGLSANTEYFYRVKAVSSSDANVYSKTYPDNNVGVGAYTSLGSLTLQGFASAYNQIYLSWTHSSGATEFVIERKNANGSFAAVATLASGTGSWYDSGVIPNVQYTYRVKAKSLSNESVYSNEVTVANTYLEAPSFLQATVNADSAIELKWTDNSTSETAFEVWRRVHTTGDYELIATLGQNARSFTDDKVHLGIQYYYMVRAYSSFANTYSAFSNSVSAGAGMLTPPSNLQYTVVTDTQITLTWTDNSDKESSYKIERKVEDGEWTEVTTLSSNTQSYTVTGLTPYVRYYYRVKAHSYSYSSDSYSNEIEVSTGTPRAPSGLKLKALFSSKVSLTWTDNSINELGFKIERKKSGERNYRVVGEVGPDITSYTDSGLKQNSKYYYRIKAYNKSGSAESGIESITTTELVTFNDVKGVSLAKEAIENLASRGIIKGNSEGKFRPDDTITRAEFVSLIVRAFNLQVTAVGSFGDVKPGKWYYRDLMAARALGIVGGDDKNMFYPDKAITREDMAIITFKAMSAVDNPLEGHSNEVLEKFRDKNLISPYALASVASLYGEGILNERSATSIAPKDKATRAEAAVMIYKVLNK